MEIFLIEENAEIKIDNLSIKFLSAPNDFLISEENGYYHFNARKNITATSWADNDVFNIILNKTTTYTSLFSVQLNFDFITMESDSISLEVEGKSYTISFDGCNIKLDDENILLISVVNPVASINVYNADVVNNLSFKALTLPAIIDEYESVPEFSISCYDDSNFTKPRPIRFGIPVISTVPSMIDGTSTREEIDTYNSGKGLDLKTIYFRVFADQILETLTAGAASSLVSLKVYLPNGLDTIKEPIYKILYFSSNDSTNNRTIYTTSHTFYSQGIHNNIEYVDGLMYVDVQLNITIQQSMPIQFDFQI
jgi:hypothetical protein